MSANHRYGIPIALAAIVCTVLTACGSVKDGGGGFSASSVNPVNWVTPYKIDVIQGNFVSSEQVEQLRPGMIRDQVKATLGTPLLASLFHADRWDYVFTLKRQGVASQTYKYTVFFKGDLLERFEGDAMPSEAEFISRLDSKRNLGKAPVLQATEEQLKAAERPSAARSSATNAGTASTPLAPEATAYPPLESPKQ